MITFSITCICICNNIILLLSISSPVFNLLFYYLKCLFFFIFFFIFSFFFSFSFFSISKYSAHVSVLAATPWCENMRTHSRIPRGSIHNQSIIYKRCSIAGNCRVELVWTHINSKTETMIFWLIHQGTPCI